MLRDAELSGLVVAGGIGARSATEFSLFLTESFRGDYLDLRQNADIITMIFGYGSSFFGTPHATAVLQHIHFVSFVCDNRGYASRVR